MTDESDETSRYITVFHQLKETESGEPGDRFVVHGEKLGDRCKFDEEQGDFIPVARPIAVIDVGTKMADDETIEWCNSHAGKAVLNQFFPEIEPTDPTLPDAGEYLEDIDD
ncbi:hypothetical protein [Halocatena halophila]|uniref:hypothetical protein n=1 Tax=Halocatena halophila TaxID=2814576 RepID=UPI002ED10403